MASKLPVSALLSLIAVSGVWAACSDPEPVEGVSASTKKNMGEAERSALEMVARGRDVFRFDTFGSEAFWGGKLELHRAVAGEANGGVGPGLSPKAALGLGLKVDVDALPKGIVRALRNGTADLESAETTLALLRADAVIGVKGFFDSSQKLESLGITCSFCHAAVDDSLTKGVGSRRDGWPNRDLDVGKIVALAPSLAPFAELLEVDEATVRTVLESWGPGKYDAQLNHDGKAFRPDGKSGATVIPAAFGMAGVNLHTYTGFGSVPYWNAYVATTQMFGQGTFFDPRLNDAERFPVAARSGRWNIRSENDLVTAKLGVLHVYQLVLTAPKPPPGSFDSAVAARGETVFAGAARCATCHVPPLFTEPGWAMHSAEEMGIDDFQASRSPEAKYYRTTPLGGLFTRAKPGFYHDGRFPDLDAVVAHYEKLLGLELGAADRSDLIEYLKSL